MKENPCVVMHHFARRQIVCMLFVIAWVATGSSLSFGAVAGYNAPCTNDYPTGMMQVVNRYTTPDPDLEMMACGVADPSKGYVYFGTGDLVTKVLKLRISDMTCVAELPFEDDEYGIYSAVIDTANGYAYFPLMMHGVLQAPGAVVKVRLSDFTRVKQLVMKDVNETLFACGVIDTVRGFAYFGTHASPAKIVKVRLSDFTRAAAMTLPESYLFTACIDAYGGYAYFGTRTDPGKIVKIRLSDFTRVGSITLNAGERRVISSVIDPAGGYAYFGLETSPGKIVKVRLHDFKRAATLTLNDDESGLEAAEIDTQNGYVYFGTNCTSERGNAGVVKIRLSDFTRAGTLKFNPGERGLISSAIDTSRGYLFFGNLKDPVGVLKVNLSFKNTIFANLVRMPCKGKVSDIRFYSHVAGGNVRLGIYDASRPNKLVWQSASTKIEKAGAWVTIPISKGTPTKLTLDVASYRLAWQIDSTAKVPSGAFGLDVPDDTGFVIDNTYGSFPSIIPDLKGRIYSTTIWSEYITYTPINAGAGEWVMYR